MLPIIVPIGHVSDLNVPRCNMLYSIIQEDHTMNVSRVISDKIKRFVDLEVNQEKDKKHGVLGFLTLITTLCQSRGVFVEQRIKIRPLINKKFITHNCTNPKEDLDAVNQPPHSPAPKT